MNFGDLSGSMLIWTISEEDQAALQRLWERILYSIPHNKATMDPKSFGMGIRKARDAACSPGCTCLDYIRSPTATGNDAAIVQNYEFLNRMRGYGRPMSAVTSAAWSREVSRRLELRGIERERAERVHCQPDDLDLCP